MGRIVFQGKHDGRGLVSQNPGLHFFKTIKAGAWLVLEVTEIKIKTAARRSKSPERGQPGDWVEGVPRWVPGKVTNPKYVYFYVSNCPLKPLASLVLMLGLKRNPKNTVGWILVTTHLVLRSEVGRPSFFVPLAPELTIPCPSLRPHLPCCIVAAYAHAVPINSTEPREQGSKSTSASCRAVAVSASTPTSHRLWS